MVRQLLSFKRIQKLALNLLITVLIFTTLQAASRAATQIDIIGPAGSQNFGEKVYALPNGNIVVVDSFYDLPGPIVNVGAVYLYNGTNGTLISLITGSIANDRVGSGEVKIVAGGNFVVRSPLWNNGAATTAGAVTWCSGATGCSGTVSAANSLVGMTTGDGGFGNFVTVLANGNYVVQNADWDNGAVVDAGAVTFATGATGISGPITDVNSLVGSQNSDRVGSAAVFALTNGNYVASSPSWDNGAAINAGAATWGSGVTGISGPVTAANSLAGSTSGDNVGSPSITTLNNGHYVVRSPSWNNAGLAGAGAATWGNGATGVSGVISAANSLVGGSANDNVSSGDITALANGNYVVASPNWDNGALFNSGAATWGNGTAGIVGTISSANSLIGAVSFDTIGSNGVTALTNGNYVVSSSAWRNGAVNTAGAVTWANGATGLTGSVTTANSMVGSLANDRVGIGGVTALANGNYVIRSQNWRNGAVTRAGAVTWGDGTTGTTGAVSSANSLVGSQTDDGSSGYVLALPNGNYVASASNWDNGAVVDAGAVTWGNGMGGTAGTISAANSLVGSVTLDTIGGSGVRVLTNGNYVIASRSWDNGAIVNAGAATWGNGLGGTVGPLSAANSLVGSKANDNVATDDFIVLANGNYVVRSPNWDNGAVLNAGAATFGNGATGITGTISASNSLIGSTTNDSVGGSGPFIAAVPNGNYIVYSPGWDNGALTGVGALTYGAGNRGTTGTINADNSVRGTVVNGGSAVIMGYAYNAFHETVVMAIPGSSMVSIFDPTFTSVSDGDWSAAATWNYGAFTKPHDVYIPDGRTVDLDVVSTVRSLRVDCAGAVTGAGAGSYIIGSIRKDFCGPGPFTYPAGTTNGYSPVDANITAIATDPSSLTISAAQTAHPSLNAANSLKRFWTLTESGDLTTDLTFHYLDPLDISSAESTYGLYRVVGGTPGAVTPFTLNMAANTISTTNVSSFSDWAVGNLAPTAAGVNVGGRVMTAEGAGIANVKVTLAGGGVTREAVTSSLGYYHFADVETGEVYVVSVTSKRFTFAAPTVALTVIEDNSDVNFIAEP